MTDKDIKKSYEKSAERMEGNNKTLSGGLKNEDFNDPALHDDIHEKVQVDYEKMDRFASMEEVHKWQREHIAKKDQSKEGYPLNVIIDPDMREMYQVVHDADMSNVFDRFSQQQPIQCKFCIEGLSCQLCANGPCRISPKVPRGVCGVRQNDTNSYGNSRCFGCRYQQIAHCYWCSRIFIIYIER